MHAFRASVGIVSRLLLAAALCLVMWPGMASPDAAADRFVVTFHMPAMNGPMVSPSGRMNYLPMSPTERRRLVARQAREVAEAFDLIVDEEWPIPALGVNCVVFRLQHPEQRERVMQELSTRTGVDAVQSLNFFTAAGDEPDAAASSREEPGSDILQQLAGRASGRHVSIAVIDTGADLAHRNLQDANISSRDMVAGVSTTRATLPPEEHGTAIIGLLLASGGNGVDVHGYVPDADVRLLRACWEEADPGLPARCNTFTLAKALSDVIESPVDIVNLSISGPRDSLLERLGRVLVNEQVVLVAGGESRNGFPGSVTGGLLAVDMLVRSSKTMTLLPGDRFGLRKGSSIDAARLTALSALLKEMDPDTSVENIISYLEHHSLNRGTTPSGEPGILFRQ